MSSGVTCGNDPDDTYPPPPTRKGATPISESGDYDPGEFRKYDFKDERKTFDASAGRSYADAINSGKKETDLVPETLKTLATRVLFVFCDITGSMGAWPATIFAKLGLLATEGKEYLGKDMEIGFGAIGDAQAGDRYPLQVQPFTKGVALRDTLQKLVVVGGGGGTLEESYELAALYAARNIEMPNAIQPILIIIGDERPYNFVSKEMAKEIARVNLKKDLSTKEIFAELKRKFSVYLVRKPYQEMSDNRQSPTDQGIYASWVSVLGPQWIAELPSADRIVDVILGILAVETGRGEYFDKEIRERQTPEQVNTVYKSLATVMPGLSSDDSKKKPGKNAKKDSDKKSGRSVMREDDDDSPGESNLFI